MKIAPLIAPIVLAALAACAELPAEPDENACGAARYAGDIGRPVSELDLPAEGRVRVIGPNDAVTLDYVVERLNIEVDAQRRVLRAYCG